MTLSGHRAHLVKPHAHTAPRKREGGFAARQPRADHVDDWKTHRKCQRKDYPSTKDSKLDRNQRGIRKDQNEEAPQRKDIRRFLARPPPPSSPETIGGEEVRRKRLTIVSEIAYGLAGVGAGALPSGAAAAGAGTRYSHSLLGHCQRAPSRLVTFSTR
jgi:hypothetical protein